jgi:hypothetical protein
MLMAIVTMQKTKSFKGFASLCFGGPVAPLKKKRSQIVPTAQQ